LAEADAVSGGRSREIVAGAGVQLRELLPRPAPGGAGLVRGPQGLILNVFTERAWRRRGVAAALMRELLRWCRANGIESLVLHASADGRPLYEKLGFTPTNEMRACSRKRPCPLTPLIRSDSPGTPGRSMHTPRTTRRTCTPAWDARYSPPITLQSARPLSLARMRPPRPARACSASLAMRAR